MKKISPLLLCLLSLGLAHCSRQEQPKIENTAINVSSLVCGSCARTIEVAVKALDGVQEVSVDVGEKRAKVKYLPAKTDVKAIENAIANSGYDANSTKRSPKAYEKLDACCKIDG